MASSSKASAPHPSGWLGETARRVDDKQNVVGGPAHTQWRSLEASALRKVAKTESKSVAAHVLSAVGGDGLEMHANMDWFRMASAIGAWQRARLAVRPARFEPQEATRIVEGRPVQAL